MSQTYTLRTRDLLTGENTSRTYWVHTGSGYVYEVDASHPGTLGRQVSGSLAHRGTMMMSSPERLAEDIRRARRREIRSWRRTLGDGLGYVTTCAAHAAAALADECEEQIKESLSPEERKQDRDAEAEAKGEE